MYLINKILVYWNSLTVVKKIFITITILIVVGLKLFYNYANFTNLNWLIKPTAHLTGLFLNQTFEYNMEYGYYFPGENMVINKSCSGLVFFIISICTAIFAFAPKINGKYFPIAYVLLILSAYLLTILVNSSRILIDQNTKKILGINTSGALHETTGVFVYLIFLVCFYLIINQIIKPTRNESFT